MQLKSAIYSELEITCINFSQQQAYTCTYKYMCMNAFIYKDLPHFNNE
jgi:hypothetical protein